MLTLDSVAKHPGENTYSSLTQKGSKLYLRPLVPEDDINLALFFAGLSDQTREFYSFSGSPGEHAQALCLAINRYDKLRYIVEPKGVEAGIIGLIEFSFAILDEDIQRYLKYGINLDPNRDCRYGLCLSDSYQNQGIGSLLFEHVKSIAHQFGKERIILWGGVFSDNDLAISHYKRNGFTLLGDFVNMDGQKCFDMIYLLVRATFSKYPLPHP